MRVWGTVFFKNISSEKTLKITKRDYGMIQIKGYRDLTSKGNI